MDAAGLYLLRSGAGSNQDQQEQPIESHPLVDEASIDQGDRLVHVTILDGDVEIGSSANDPRRAAAQQQLTNVKESPDDRRNRWLAALEDIRSSRETQPSESPQDPSETVEPDGSSVADRENASDDTGSAQNEIRHPHATRRIGGDVPIHQNRKPPGLVVEPGGTDPPVT
jgi:hypothetical protein